MYFYNKKRLNDRTIDELIGLSRGITADDIVNHDEAKFLQKWMEANASFCDDRIINQIYCRVQEMLVDGVFDKEEQQELFDILKTFTGDSTQSEPGDVVTNISTAIPFDDPLPPVEFPTMAFCLTGKFAYGPRRVCHEIIIERGGVIKTCVSNAIDYLVIGYFGSTDWIHTPYGRKIEKAVQIRSGNSDLAIIPEDYWLETAFKM